jgi:hypothetical protein
MDKNMREDNQSSADGSERYQPEEEKKEEESEDEYNGGRPSQFKDAQWRQTEEDKKRNLREK